MKLIIKLFEKSKKKSILQFKDSKNWLMDFTILVDLNTHFNELNVNLR